MVKSGKKKLNREKEEMHSEGKVKQEALLMSRMLQC